jgi:6-phosphogluconolactonase
VSGGGHEGILRVWEDRGAATEALARFLTAEIQASLQRTGRCRLALSGGSTPRLLFDRLAEADLAGSVPWEGVHFYWSDERCVPPQDPSSNFAMAKESWLDHLPLKPDQIHTVDGTLPPEAAAASYAAQVGDQPLDIVLLGMGGDGHTASLFPGGPELEEEQRVAVATRSPLPPRDRISLSLLAINRARCVVFLVVGADKAAMVARVMAERGAPDDPGMLPAARVRPSSGSLYWFLDRPASSSLGGDQGPS